MMKEILYKTTSLEDMMSVVEFTRSRLSLPSVRPTGQHPRVFDCKHHEMNPPRRVFFRADWSALLPSLVFKAVSCRNGRGASATARPRTLPSTRRAIHDNLRSAFVLRLAVRALNWLSVGGRAGAGVAT